MPAPAADFLAALRALARREVEFVIIGGVGAVLQGAPVATFDLDIVPRRTPDNLERLAAALQDLEARYLEHRSRDLQPRVQDLSGPGHHLLLTSAGPLDVLGVVIGGEGFEELHPKARPMRLDQELTVLVLDLEHLIELKRRMGREKDLAVLPILERTLLERRRRP